MTHVHINTLAGVSAPQLLCWRKKHPPKPFLSTPRDLIWAIFQVYIMSEMKNAAGLSIFVVCCVTLAVLYLTQYINQKVINLPGAKKSIRRLVLKSRTSSHQSFDFLCCKLGKGTNSLLPLTSQPWQWQRGQWWCWAVLWWPSSFPLCSSSSAPLMSRDRGKQCCHQSSVLVPIRSLFGTFLTWY